MASLIGQSTGRYHIIEQLGSGGMAIVYRAYDTNLECDVAIKFIRMEKLTPENSEKAHARFKIEAQKTAKLLHPNIVTVTDYGEFEGTPFLVMRYIPGGKTLKSLMGKPMSYEEAIKLIIPVAQALEVAHEANIVHRDVKPSNILLTDKGIPMLSDFGIAKVLEEDDTKTHDGLTTAGMAIGTPEYMAPEQWEGKPVDGRADIYALGVVLYEMITGRPPFKADTVPATMVQVLRDPLPRPSLFVKGLPENIEQVLYKSLARDPHHRYSSMSEFLNALTSISIEQSDNSSSSPQKKIFWILLIVLPFIVLSIYRIITILGKAETITVQTIPTVSTVGVPTISSANSANNSNAGATPIGASLMITPTLRSYHGCNVSSHLQVGDLAYISIGNGYNGIRTQPDTTQNNSIGKASGGQVLLITAGPICDNVDYLLWNVKPEFSATWEEGWTPEVARNIGEYWLQPVPYWTPCGGTQLSHLKVGDQVYVSIINDIANRVRNIAGQGGQKIGTIQPGEQVLVVDGPKCVDDMVWWQIKNNQGLTGWTSEGSGVDYWLIPLISQ